MEFYLLNFFFLKNFNVQTVPFCIFVIFQNYFFTFKSRNSEDLTKLLSKTKSGNSGNHEFWNYEMREPSVLLNYRRPPICCIALWLCQTVPKLYFQTQKSSESFDFSQCCGNCANTYWSLFWISWWSCITAWYIM